VYTCFLSAVQMVLGQKIVRTGVRASAPIHSSGGASEHAPKRVSMACTGNEMRVPRWLPCFHAETFKGATL
jgi:hypothetical protein